MTFRNRATTVMVFAAAMAYVESACVVYLERALSITPDQLFPLRGPQVVGDLAAIEVGREGATIAMLAAVGILVGRRAVGRLAWTAVAFGVWDIAYYGWLWLFLGWPHSPLTWDVLFLIPLPWIGPVWAPLAVSVALVVFGLMAVRAEDRDRPPAVGRREAALGLVGGSLVILSFTLDAPRILGGGQPGWFPWPVFVAGMAVAATGAWLALRRGVGQRVGLSPSGPPR
jgi:hypothetical protein